MIEKSFTIALPDDNRIRIRFEKRSGLVLRFTVQLESFIDQEWYTIVRYDTAHGFAHSDVLHPDGSAEKRLLDCVDYNQAFTESIEDIRSNYTTYRRRYEQWRS